MPILPSKNNPINCGLATTTSFERQFIKQPVATRSMDVFVAPQPNTTSQNLISQMRAQSGIPVYWSVSRLSTFQQGSVSSVSYETIKDSNYHVQNFPVFVSDCKLTIQTLNTKFGNAVQLFTRVNYPKGVISVKSSNTNVLDNPTPENPYVLRFKSIGKTNVQVELKDGEICAAGFETFAQTESPVYTLLNFTSGSLADHIYTQLSSIATVSSYPPSYLQIYSTFDYTNNIYVKNSGFWASSLDFSGVSVNKLGSGGVTSVSMITPRHAIGARHYPPIVGDKMYFCDSDNNTIEKTIVARTLSPYGDTVIVKFDSDVPNSIKKYKFLPTNWGDYLPVNYPISRSNSVLGTGRINQTYVGTKYWKRGAGIPMIVMSHYRWDSDWPIQRSNRYAYIFNGSLEASGFLVGVSFNGSDTALSLPPDKNYFNEQFKAYDGQPSGIQGGDSGLPKFYVINGELIYLAKHFTAVSGTLLSDDPEVSLQDSINWLGSEGYQIQTINLSEFTNFSL